MNSLNIIGAGGHSRSVIALLRNNGFTVKGIYDDSYTAEKNEQIFGIPVCGKINEVPLEEQVCLAVGNNLLREELHTNFSKNIFKDTIKHSSALIEKETIIGDANLIFANVFINAGASVGNNNILNTGCIIEHECSIGNNNHISVSSVLCGRVKIGNSCFIGAGAIIKDSISICDNVTVGAGCVVVKNITEPGVYAGNPSKRIK